jgi:hypothetical protein
VPWRAWGRRAGTAAHDFILIHPGGSPSRARHVVYTCLISFPPSPAPRGEAFGCNYVAGAELTASVNEHDVGLSRQGYAIHRDSVGRERVVRRGLLRPDVSRLERLQREIGMLDALCARRGGIYCDTASRIFINTIAQPPHGEAAAQPHCRPQAAPAPSRHTRCPAAEPQGRR